MLNPFAYLRRRWMVSHYADCLPRYLFNDYGHSGPYTPNQIDASIDRHRLSGKGADRAYALAMFCDAAALADPALPNKLGLKRSFQDLRAEAHRWRPGGAGDSSGNAVVAVDGTNWGFSGHHGSCASQSSAGHAGDCGSSGGHH